jgi:hydroxymethylglutaryl-CoA reductase
MPLPVGLIGGATRVHPLARAALKILGVRSARELAEVIAAMGLIQNLGALRSLVTEGIQKGHMVLHAQNLAISAGAVGEAISAVANQMVREGRIGFDRAKQILRHVLRDAGKKVQHLEGRLRESEEESSSRPEDEQPDS